MKNAIYHVTQAEWDYSELLCARSMVEQSLIEVEDLAARWPEYPEYLWSNEAGQVHFHASLEEAMEFREEYSPCGQILEVSVEDLEAEGYELCEGSEYSHPVVWDAVPAHLVAAVEGA